MRKLLVLSAVLAMGSVSQAGVISLQITSLNGNPIDPVTEIMVYASDVVGMEIVYTTEGSPALLGLDSIVNAEGPGTLYVDEQTLFWPFDEGFNRIVEYVPGKSYNISTGSFGGMADTWLVGNILLHGDDFGLVTVTVGPDTAGGGTIYIDGVTPYDGQWGPGVVMFVGTIPGPVYLDIGLRLYDGTETVKIACGHGLSSPLRIAKNGHVYDVVLVEPGHLAASGIVIQTASGPKALAKLP